MKQRDIFIEALQKTGDVERDDFLNAVCGGDSALRQSVDELLAEHEKDASFFIDAPAPGLVATTEIMAVTEIPGDTIGPYKLIQQIGEGGMGTVYMAEQTEPVKRRVALKVIKAGMDSRQIITRFEAEKQALALMDHVNIARVLDAGATAQGRPYFVMELVRGVPITRYCDDHQLTLRERLELFVPVCQAIQHAHQKGIIHRDIKPSNVLVTLYDGKPVPKVIDFGVAKATEQNLTERTLFTQYGTLVGTLEYMSPEQAESCALGVDTRSDIYSLGVLLYELLTGSTPLTHKRMKESAYGEILRMIKEVEPQKPSTRLDDSNEVLASISACRHTEPAKLSKLMRGELDWIVMKCLEKDRNRRYETANGFAMDVQRYLKDETVQACPPSAGYRLRKFARRNNRALATVALLSVMLLLGVVLLVVSNVQIKKEQISTEIQKTRAETALGDARENLQLAEDNLGLALDALDEVFVKEIEKRALHTRELTPTDREFLRRGLHFYEQFSKRNGTNVELQGATAMANRRAGYLQLELAQWQEAEASFRKAIPLLEKLASDSPAAAELRRELASTRHGLSVGLQHLGLHHDAEGNCRQAIALWQQLAVEFPTEHEYRVQLGHSHWHLQSLLTATGRRQEAEGSIREALSLYEELRVGFPKELYYRQEKAFSHRLLSGMLRAQGRHLEAAEELQQAVLLYAGLVADSFSEFYRQELACSYGDLSMVLRDSQRMQEAEAADREALKLFEKLAQEFPKYADYRRGLAHSQMFLAHLLWETKRYPEAEEYYRRARDLYKQLTAEDHAGLDDWHQLAMAYQQLGYVLQAAGRPDEVPQAYEQATQAHREALALNRKRASDSPTPENRWREADSLSYLGEVLRLAGQPEEAIDAWCESAKILEKLVTEFNFPDHGWMLASRHDQLGHLLKEMGRYPEAENAYRDAVAAWKKLVDDFNQADHRDSLIRAQVRLAEVLLSQDKHVEAIACYRKISENDPKNAQVNNDLGGGANQKKLDEAFAAFEESLRLQPGSDRAQFGFALALAKSKQWDLSASVYGAALERFGVLLWPGPWYEALRSEELFTRLTARRPDDHLPWIMRARLHILQSEWERAAKDYVRVNELLETTDEDKPGREPDDEISYGCLLLLQADNTGYEQFCKNWADQFGPDQIWEVSLARTWVVSPRAVVPPWQLAEWERTCWQASRHSWSLHVLSLAQYRIGEFERSIEYSNESNLGDWSGSAKALNGLMLAMAHQRLGHAAEARTSLEQALLLAGQPSPDQPPGVTWPNMAPSDAVEFELLRREAEQLINPKPLETDPGTSVKN